MDNRFLVPELRDNRFLRGTGAMRPSAQRAAIQGGGWSKPMGAEKRSLVILIENGGVDLGIPELVDKLLALIPGADQVPAAAKQRLVEWIRKKVVEATDRLLESAELSVNRYTAAVPALFGTAIVLRDGTATYEDLRRTLFEQSRAGRVIDLLVLTHGGPDVISLASDVNGQKIRDLRREFGKSLSLRSVYMMNCNGSTLNQAWLDAGAKVSSGAVRTNYLPEPTTFFFWSAWKSGRPFDEAVTSAYQRTIDLMDEAVRAFLRELPAPLNLLATVVNLGAMDFVKDSAPVIQGDGTLTISAEDLVFAQSIPPQSMVARTALPLGLLRALSQGAAVTPAPDGAVRLLQRWTPEAQAPSSLQARAASAQHTVDQLVHMPLNAGQNDALVSFVDGIGAERFRMSTLLEALNRGERERVPAEMRKWVKVRRGGAVVELPALQHRRDIEARVYEGQEVEAVSQSLRAWSLAQDSAIPLDPGNGGRSIGVEALRTGDIIVTTRPGPVPALIRFATAGPVSHSLLYIGGGQVVEAIESGVKLRSLEEALDGATVAVAFRAPDLPQETALRVRDYVGQQLDKAYNYTGVVRQAGFRLDRATFCGGLTGQERDACIRWVGAVNLGKGGDSSFFCSQLIVAAFEAAGVPLTEVPPHWVSPNDLALLGMGDRIGYVGHLKAPPAPRE